METEETLVENLINNGLPEGENDKVSAPEVCAPQPMESFGPFGPDAPMSPAAKALREITGRLLYKEDDEGYNGRYVAKAVDGVPVDRSEIPADAVIVTGMFCGFGFHPGRLAEARGEIIELLKNVPPSFFKDDGDSLMYLVADAGSAPEPKMVRTPYEADALFCLAQAVDCAVLLLPRKSWRYLKHGLPVVKIVLPAAEATEATEAPTSTGT